MFSRKTLGFFINCNRIAKYSTSSDTIIPLSINFTSEEESKILNFLNTPNVDHLSRLKISHDRIKSIENWKSRKGPFRSLSDILEVSGLDEKVLEQLGDVIKNGTTIQSNNKRMKQLVNPPISPNLCKAITSAVGIHLSPLGMSWARISKKGNKLNSWNFHDFSSLPKKMLPTDTFELAISVMPRIPPADVYIFESSPTLSLQGQTQTASVTSHNQLIELNCMLVALLNTSIQHNMAFKTDGSAPKRIENRVFYLRSKIPARLFRTLVGTERVAAIDIVTGLVENTGNAACTAIGVDSQIRAAYLSQLPSNKELLGQALMLIIGFMDLCVYKSSISIAALSPIRKAKE